jgi:hypothetical protein
MTFQKRTFGVEIEYVGVERDVIINALADIGVKCVSEHYNHNTRKHWKIVRDGSLRHRNGDSYTGELVSPPLSGKRGLDKLRKVVDAIKMAGATVNNSCGLHVHVGVKDFTPNQIVAIPYRYGYLESKINKFMDHSRIDSTWASTVSKSYVSDIVENINYAMRGAYKLHFKKAVLNVTSKYRKVNISSYGRYGTVEFRQHQGTVNSEMVCNWVQFCLHFVEHIFNNVPQTKDLALPAKKDLKLFNEIPEEVASYYKNLVKKKDAKSKAKAQKMRVPFEHFPATMGQIA